MNTISASKFTRSFRPKMAVVSEAGHFKISISAFCGLKKPDNPMRFALRALGASHFRPSGFCFCILRIQR